MPRIAEEAQQDFAREYSSQEHGSRRAFAENWAKEKGISAATAFRILKKQSALGAKKQRSDAGKRALKPEVVRHIASIQEASRRKTGSVTMPTGVALDIAQMNGIADKPVSAGYLGAMMRELGFDSRTLSKAAPHGKVSSMPLDRRSDYPLQWLFVDVSVCLQYRFGKKGELRFEPMTRYYGKDLKNYTNKRQALYRYAAVDHFTKFLYIHYYYSSGERTDDWVDFLIRCFFMKPFKDQCPFMGVPENIYTDRGSGLNNPTGKNFLKALDINLFNHLPGNPRAKGAVEVGHKIWQANFESRLAVEPAKSLEELNSRKEISVVQFNAQNQMRGAHGATRFELWNKGVFLIPAGKWRTLPEGRLDAVRALAHREPEKKYVTTSGLISYDGPKYRVNEPSLIGKEVFVYPSPYHEEDTLIVLYNGEKFEAPRIEKDEFGFFSDAVPLGEWERAKDGLADRNIKELAKIDLSNLKAFPGSIGDIAAVGAISARTAKNEIELSDDGVFVNDTRAREWLREQVGAARYRVYIDDVDRLLSKRLTRAELNAARDEIIAIADARAEEMNKRI